MEEMRFHSRSTITDNVFTFVTHARADSVYHVSPWNINTMQSSRFFFYITTYCVQARYWSFCPSVRLMSVCLWICPSHMWY